MCLIIIYSVIDWPWDEGGFLSNFRDWMFLPDSNSPPDAYKLLCNINYLFN